MLIPGYAAASERRDDLTALVFAASTVLPLALYLLASWILVRRVDRKPFSALGLRFDRGALVGLLGGIHVAVAIATALGFTANGPGMWLTVGALHILVGVLVAALVPRSRWAEVRAAGPYARPAAHEIPGDSPSITR